MVNVCKTRAWGGCFSSSILFVKVHNFFFLQYPLVRISFYIIFIEFIRAGQAWIAIPFRHESHDLHDSYSVSHSNMPREYKLTSLIRYYEHPKKAGPFNSRKHFEGVTHNCLHCRLLRRWVAEHSHSIYRANEEKLEIFVGH